MRKQRIVIIGAGTAGLATATLLARQGHEVTLVERAKALTAVGAGILLQPSGIGALAEIGCLDHICKFGHRVDALYGSTRSGRPIMNVEYAHLGAEQESYGLGVHRAALCHVLDVALSGAPHTRWFGCEVQALDQRANEVVIALYREGQSHHEAFDAVIVANGSASKLRPQTLVRYDRQYPWGAMWLIHPITEDGKCFDRPILQQRYDGSEVMLGVLPSGSAPSDIETRMLSLFWSLPTLDIPRWQKPDFDFDGWKNSAVELWPELSSVLGEIKDASAFLPATYRDVIMVRWGAGRIGIIGDAAHAMSPQLGQGANMALLDALAISNAVEASLDWDEVWQHFHGARQASIRFYQRMSRLLTPMFQSRIVGAALLRDLSFPVSYRVPWLRRQMTETVAGRKKSWL